MKKQTAKNVEKLVAKRRGVVGELEQEIYNVVTPIVLKYKKTYLGKGISRKDRMRTIVSDSVDKVIWQYLY